jgi:hypothetical protein
MRYLFDEGCVMFETTASTASTANIPDTSELLAGIHDAMTRLDALRREQEAADYRMEQWMRDRGYPPETSLLVLPDSMRVPLVKYPAYIRFSQFIQSPVLMADVMGKLKHHELSD